MDLSWTENNHRAPRALLLAMAILALAAPAASAAEGERVLDPELSLTGACKGPEALDPIEDPGCPYAPFPAGPSGAFSNPRAVATDDYGNIYVSSFGGAVDGSQGRIDIFDSQGEFISELKVNGPTSLAIGSQGYLYVFAEVEPGTRRILRFKPDAPYEPQTGGVQYTGAPASLTNVVEESFYSGLAINRGDDHLFANFGTKDVREYASATEGNALIRSTSLTPGSWGGNAGMAIDATRDRMYASAGTSEERIDVFDLSTVEGTPPNDEYKKIGSILDSSVPDKDFGTQLSIAVNEGDGHLFVLDGENCRLYEFDQSGTYLATIEFPLVCTFAGEIAIDNGPFSPNGKMSEEAGKGRYLYVPSHRTGTGHSFAFFESTVGTPEVKSPATANASEDEVELRAQVDPNNLQTAYSFEYIAEQAAAKNEEELKGPFTGATPAGEGTLPAGNLLADVSSPASGLSPGTSYRFRVVATNEEGSDEAQGSFTTYPSVPTETEPCPNALLRGGPSALLPDCRAYELVTPPDTNARAPLGAGGEGGVFTTRQVSPAGDRVPFRVEGGSLPGLGGTGSQVGDPYLATRTPTGWSTAYTGPSAAEATAIAPGTTSPDQGYSFWWAGVSGSAVLAPITGYLRYPDGHSELLGQGSLGVDPESSGKLISEGGSHIVFATGAFASSSTAVQLEPEAALSGTTAVYDRTADGITHVVSVKPDGGPFNQDAFYQGASPEGEGIAFKVGNTLYLRYRDEETLEIGTGVDFAGVAEDGGRVFYVQGGNLKAFDVEVGMIDFSTTGDVTPVTVVADGSSAYFISPSAIAGSGPNPAGDEPQGGEQNLYRSEEGQIEFLATVTDRDVEGRAAPHGDGLGLWVEANQQLPEGRLGLVPARATPDGEVFLFKSRAALTGYATEGHAEIYRYAAAASELQCISCNPTGAPASADATLQSEDREGGAELYSAFGWPENLRADGRRAFFESAEALVASDSDGRQDVYEWEAQGVGSCKRPGGCVYLISSPQSRRGEYLYAVSRSGEDVFILSSELLVGADADETPSIYDARVGGGFPEAAQGVCEGEGCRPRLSSPPALPDADTRVRGAGDEVRSSCAKGKRRVKRAGKVRCAKKKHHRKQAKRHRAVAERKGGSR
jgi:hypothetical protein